ncbi:MAG: DUF3836 domain-containing protein [Bacteroides sp.]|nr:DUF3836 domain-containing protein [Bacteroides sp.]
MKKSFMSISMLIVSVSMVAMLLFGSVAQAQQTKGFVYDKKENVEVVFLPDQTGRYLTPKLKYEFACDEAGQVVAKNAYLWNATSSEWMPYYRMDYTFTSGQQIIDYGVWNQETGGYSMNTQRVVYEIDVTQEVLACEYYKWNPTVESWEVYQQLRLIELLADQAGE